MKEVKSGEERKIDFRSFLSSIDRRIEIDRIDVEKSRIQNTEKSTARQRKIGRVDNFCSPIDRGIEKR